MGYLGLVVSPGNTHTQHSTDREGCTCLFKDGWIDGAQSIKHHANLNLIPKTHIKIVGEKWLPEVVLLPPHIHLAHVLTLSHINYILTHNNNNKF